MPAYKYFYKGKMLMKYCQENNISYHNVIERIKNNNMTIEEAINYKHPFNGRRVKYVYNGRPAVDVARENGINNIRFMKRLKNGWSIENACTIPHESIKSKIYREWKKHPECEYAYTTVYNRYRIGVPLEKIFDKK